MAFSPVVTAEANSSSQGSQTLTVVQISGQPATLQKGGNFSISDQKKISLKPLPLSNLKSAKVPVPVSAISAVKQGFTDADWKFLKASMTDLSEKDQNSLIDSAKEILNGTSKLSKDEQNAVLKQIGHYIILATEGGGGISPQWAGEPGHYELSMAVQQNLGSLSTSHANLLGDYATWADNNRLATPPLPGLIENRHSWVLDGTGIPGLDNYGPDSLAYYINNARTDFQNYDADSAYTDIGKSLHYIEDLGCPYHTTGGSLYEHSAYETWVMDNWNSLNLTSAIQVDGYYVIDDPASDAKLLAEYSNQFIPYFNSEILNDPNWQTNPNMIYWTQVLNTETEKMTIGMVQYANKYESPDTVGGNSVPIQGLQTSYATISGIASSDPMVFPVRITYPNSTDLEIWLGARQDSSQSYTYYKIWDRQSYGSSDMILQIRATGFQDMHDWQLVVRDDATGSEGSIDEFSVNIG